jgi:citrate lyase subunit gamma (acyl carrier protein)
MIPTEKERSLGMVIVKSAAAGTLESSDVYVEVEPAKEGINLHLESVVKQQFGEQIEETVRDVLWEKGVENASLRIVDRGALECVIRARVETALVRGKGDA